jgi:uncharacterized protein CbrC (UPF0167 family)
MEQLENKVVTCDECKKNSALYRTDWTEFDHSEWNQNLCPECLDAQLEEQRRWDHVLPIVVPICEEIE